MLCKWALSSVLVSMGFPGGSVVKRPQEMAVQSLGPEDSLRKKMTTHSSILSWKIPWT